MPIKHSKQWPLNALMLAVWTAVVGTGFLSLWGYETSAGTVRQPPAVLPDSSPVPALPTLIMAVHPNCPCTHASISELALLMAHAHGRLTATVLFAQPPGLAGDPASTDLWASAAAIPGVLPQRDPNARRCQALHATISGQVFLYDAKGTLQFTGGITGSRGHEGDNEGLASIEAFLDTGHATHATTPVYGCTLH
jgi:hypothetical protein